MSNSNKTNNKYKVLLNKYRDIASFGELKVTSINSESKVNFFLRPTISNTQEDSENLIKMQRFNKYKEFNLKIIILGSSQGIGLDLATILSNYGFDVTATYRTSNYKLIKTKFTQNKKSNFEIGNMNHLRKLQLNLIILILL